MHAQSKLHLMHNALLGLEWLIINADLTIWLWLQLQVFVIFMLTTMTTMMTDIQTDNFTPCACVGGGGWVKKGVIYL